MCACLVVHVQCVCVLINRCFDAFWSFASSALPLNVTFELCHTPLHWLGRGLPTQFTQLMRWRTQVEWRAQSGWRRGCHCMKGCWRKCGWWGHRCVPFGVVQAVLYYWPCLWTSTGLSVVGQNFFENRGPWGTGWCCCRCVLARPNFRMHTSFSSCNTTAADMIEWEWLGIFYLMDIKVISAPPPILLVLHFKLGWRARTSIEVIKWKGAWPRKPYM